MPPYVCSQCNTKIKDDVPCRIQKGKLYRTTCLHDIVSDKEQKKYERMGECILDYGIPKSFVDELCGGDNGYELESLYGACTSGRPWILLLESACGYYATLSYSSRACVVDAIRNAVLEDDESVKYLFWKGKQQKVKVLTDIKINDDND